MLTLIDAILSDISENNIVSFKKRVWQMLERFIGKQIPIKEARKLFYLFTIVKYFNRSIFKNYKFNKIEPIELYRDWLLHGKYKRSLNQTDFLKTHLFLTSILYIASLLKSTYRSNFSYKKIINKADDIQKFESIYTEAIKVIENKTISERCKELLLFALAVQKLHIAQYDSIYDLDKNTCLKIIYCDKQELDKLVYQSAFSKTNNTIRGINIDHLINYAIHRLSKTSFISLFNQSINAFRMNMFKTACIGIMTIDDGLIQYTDNKSHVKTTKYIEAALQKLLNKPSKEGYLNDIHLGILLDFFDITNGSYKPYSIYTCENFDFEETLNLNRNRLAHGRTFREYNEVDFLKYILRLRFTLETISAVD